MHHTDNVLHNEPDKPLFYELLSDPKTEHFYWGYNERLLQMPYEARLRAFLADCNRPGSKYSPERCKLPNLSRLAVMCSCSCSTLNRILTGETKSPGLGILSVLNAVACICPPAFDNDILKERHARIRDANRWVAKKEKGESKGTIMDALHAGISKRIEAAKLERHMT